MTGNIERAALILGVCTLFKYSYGVNLNLKTNDTMTPEYCAGLKTGEAIRKAFK